MVQVQSSWFPLYDRNPQTFVENIGKAQPGDYRAATQRIWFTPEQASFVELPVVRARLSGAQACGSLAGGLWRRPARTRGGSAARGLRDS